MDKYIEPNMKRVLITGGAGFIGTNIARRFLKQGYKVVSVDNYHTGLDTNHLEGVEYIEADIRNISDYSAWGKFDIVYHMAAIARIQPSFDHPKDYFTVNGTGTQNVAHYCAKNNIPLVYAGSSSKHSGRFKNPYTFSKDVGEDIIELYRKHYGLKASITRFYNVYGPNQLEVGGYCTVIGIWLKAFRDGNTLLVTGDGEQRRDFTHVDDIVDALYRIFDQQAYGKDFELGRGKNYSLNELIDIIGVVPQYVEARPGEARITLNTDTSANELLGWDPQIDIIDYINNEFK